MDIVVYTYSAYMVLSVGLTIWVAQTLFKSGRVFLVDVFAGRQELADSVNRLLVVGFYLINLGYVCLALKVGYEVVSMRQAMEMLSEKMGVVLLVLGGMHFFNMWILHGLRRADKNQTTVPPVAADGFTRIGA